MGSASSKFRRHLQNGDEYAALQVFQSSPELRQNLDPNSSYGDSFQHNSALHLVAQHGMKPLLRIFLNELLGNPRKTNASGENTLHLVCQGNLVHNSSIQQRRLSCVMLVLQWKSADSSEKIDIAAVDNEGNTALHHAAATGLLKCVEALVIHGAPLFLKNKCGETACDLAEKNSFKDIAEFLESKMVFSTNFIDSTGDSAVYLFSDEEVFNGLRAQDLQEAKDQLLVETSDMLHVPLFTAEVLLRNHEWSRQSLLDSWMSNPIECCEEAGISPPTSALQFSISNNSLKVSCERVQEEYQNESLNSPAKSVPLEAEILCEICDFTIPVDKEPVQVPCNHHFCRTCWREYLNVKIQEGDAHNILCPAYLCHYLVPIDVIEKVVSQDMVKRYLHFDIEAFVETNPKIKWCPYPCCGRAVKLPDVEPLPREVIAISCATPPEVSYSVDCGNGHYFCWECLGEAHAPVSCAKWKEWFEKIANIKPQEMKNTYAETENAANWLWLVTNSKPCPNCKSPIQKNEGCNHMKCTKCKYDYCWVCLEGWKKHSSSTGGYFRCDRFDAVHKAEAKAGALINKAESYNKQMQELKKFLHYYTKFKDHENSYKLEQPLLQTIQDKMIVLASFVKNGANSEISVQFLQDAVFELLRARRILCGSYVYGFYLEDNGYNKTIFEIMQNELEAGTKKLSEMVARSYLQKPRGKIIQVTNLVKRKRIDFITAVLKGLIPPETPPALRKSHRKRYPGLLGIDPIEDEQMSQAILASLDVLDPDNPWVRDKQGKHTNIVALCDWPYVDSDDDNDGDNATAIAAGILGVCSRKGCLKPKARNCRTGAMHDYCSLSCKYSDNDVTSNTEGRESVIDSSMDLLIALEMSKRQLEDDLQDMAGGNERTSENPFNLFPESLNSDEGEFTFNSYTIPKSVENDLGATTNLLGQNSDQSIEPEATLAKEVLESADETSCDSNSTLTSSPSGTESEICDHAHIQNTMALSFYLKISCNANEVNSRNIDSSIDNCCKTEKELFADVQKSKMVKRKERVRPSRHSL